MSAGPPNYPKRFSAAAKTYDRHDALHRHIAADLLAMMPMAATAGNALDIGCGTGLLTYAFHRKFPSVPLVAMDESEPMLHVARQKDRQATSIQWLHASFLDFVPQEPFDWIISSASLQWMGTPREVAIKLQHLCAPDTRLFLAIMTRGTLRELHALRAGLGHAYQPARSLPAFETYQDLFSAWPFSLNEARKARHALRYPDAQSLFRALHEQGVTGGPFSRGDKPMPRGILARLIQEYAERYPAVDGGIVATYEVGYYALGFEG